MGDGGQHFHLSYLDFLPACLSKGGFMSLPTFERFDVLMGRANDWLARNPAVKVVSCESLDLPWNAYTNSRNAPMLSNEESLHYEYGNRPNAYVRTLRLWIASKDPNDDPSPVRLGWLNVVPVCLKSGGIFSIPEFEPFNTTLDKLNNMLRNQPLPGKIINIETRDVKFETWTEGGVDPDGDFFFESGKAPTCFLNILRIFYQGGPPAMEVIGCVDIVPNISGSGMSIAGEPYSVIAQRANQWIAEHSGLRVCNVQSLDYKMDLSAWSARVKGVDTLRTFFYKSGKITTVFCRMIRIYYLTALDGSPPPVGPSAALTYRSFMPALVRPSGGGLMFNPKYETMSQSMGRLVSWLSQTGAKILAAETLQMIVSHKMVDPEATVIYDSGRMTDVWLYFFRIYLDGYYQDPPPSALPPPPPQEEPVNECCTLL